MSTEVTIPTEQCTGIDDFPTDHPTPSHMHIDVVYHAILHWCEMVAINHMPAANDHENDYETLAACISWLMSDVRVLVPQVSAMWTPKFEQVMKSAHSMRVVSVTKDEKQKGRQRLTRCDACGKNEECCEYAFDLAGSTNRRVSRFNESPKRRRNGVERFHRTIH